MSRPTLPSTHRLISFSPTSLLCLALTALIGACDSAGEPDGSLEVAHRSVQTAALADDGQLALIGSTQHGGSLWQPLESERLYDWNHAPGEDTLFAAVDISADGQWAVTADVATLVLWDTGKGTAERFWTAPGKILSVSVDQHANRALLGLATEVAVVFDIRRGGILHTLRHGAAVTSVALSADGTLALTGAEDDTARLWNLNTGETLAETNHQDAVQLVALSPDASLAVSVSRYDRALVWRTADQTTIGEIPLGAEKLKRGTRFTAARISADNRYLLTGRTDNRVELWDLDGFQRVGQWRLPKRKGWQPGGAAVLDVAFDGNSSGLIAVASNGFIHFLSRADIKKPD